MNWLIYISGWVWGWALVNTLVKSKEINDDFRLAILIGTWTMTWAWICWKFIN